MSTGVAAACVRAAHKLGSRCMADPVGCGGLGARKKRSTRRQPRRRRAPSARPDRALSARALPAPAGLPLQVNKSLETEREFAKKLGQQAAATKAELQAAVKAGADLGKQNAALQDDLKARRGGGFACGQALLRRPRLRCSLPSGRSLSAPC